MKIKPYTANAIPKEVAFYLCSQIQKQYRGKIYTFSGLQCWGCTTFSNKHPESSCVCNHPGYRGCNLVNARYDQMVKIGNA